MLIQNSFCNFCFFSENLETIEERKPLKNDLKKEKELLFKSLTSRISFNLDNEAVITPGALPKNSETSNQRGSLNELPVRWIKHLFNDPNVSLEEIEEVEYYNNKVKKLTKKVVAIANYLQKSSPLPAQILKNPLYHHRHLIEASAHKLWGSFNHPASQHLFELSKQNSPSEAINLIWGKFEALRTQANIYEKSFDLSRSSNEGLEIALATERFYRPSDPKYFHSIASIRKKMKSLNQAPENDSTQAHVLEALSHLKISKEQLLDPKKIRYLDTEWKSLFTGTPCFELRLVDNSYHLPEEKEIETHPELYLFKRSSMLSEGSYKKCFESTSHNHPEKSYVALLSFSKSEKELIAIQEEAHLYRNLTSKGVPFLPEVKADDLGTLIMKRYDKSLAEHSKKHPVLSSKDLIKVGYSIASCLAALHEKSLLHSDIKPQNMLVDLAQDNSIEKVALTDLGFLNNLGNADWIKTKGTTAFLIAPETWQFDCFGKSSDIYALGVSLWFCLQNTLLGFKDFDSGDQKLRFDEYDAAIIRATKISPETIKKFRDSFSLDNVTKNIGLHDYLNPLKVFFPQYRRIINEKQQLIEKYVRRHENIRYYHRYLAFRKRLSEEETLRYFLLDLNIFKEEEVKTIFSKRYINEDFNKGLDLFFSELNLDSPWDQILPIIYRCLHIDHRVRPTAQEIVDVFKPELDSKNFEKNLHCGSSSMF